MGSADKKLVVWVNEEDHARIISMQLGGSMAETWSRFCRAINDIEKIMKADGYEYMYSEHLGYILTCPSNLGTGIRAGVHVKIPLLSKHEKFKQCLDTLRLQKRGTGGVDTGSTMMAGSISRTTIDLDSPSSTWSRRSATVSTCS